MLRHSAWNCCTPCDPSPCLNPSAGNSACTHADLTAVRNKNRRRAVLRWKACRECHQQYQLPHLNQHKGQNQRTQQLRAHTARATGINSRVLVQIYGSNILQGVEKEACKAAWSGAESPCLISTEEHNEAGSLQLPTSNRLTYTPALTRELSAYPSLSLQRALCTTEARQKNLKSISEWEYLQFHFLQGVIYIAKAAGVQLVFSGLNLSAEDHRCAGSHTHTDQFVHQHRAVMLGATSQSYPGCGSQPRPWNAAITIRLRSGCGSLQASRKCLHPNWGTCTESCWLPTRESHRPVCARVCAKQS